MTNQHNTIKLILDDLYRIDESLKEREEELVGVITQLIEAKPEAELNESFRMELREQILKMARDIKLNTKFGKSRFFWADGLMGQLLKPAGLVAAGIVLGVIVTLPIMLKQGGGVEQLKSPFVFKVEQTSDRAFGSLVFESQAILEVEHLTRQAVPESDMIGKSGSVTIIDMESAIEPSIDILPSVMPIPPMQSVNYNYVYKGDDFTIDQAKMSVFQKVKDDKIASAVGVYITSINIGAFDLSRLKNAKVEQLRIAEDRPNGYLVSVNFADGSVSISQNWSKWPRSLGEQLKKADLPRDNAIIAIADKFVSDYKINLSNYGKGEVRKGWMWGYGMEEIAQYAPSQITVVYPLLIDGKQVYERSGYTIGLQVSVDVRQMKVTGLWNLSSQSYKSSMYEVETDVIKILEVAQAGQRKFYSDNSTQTLEFELGTPKYALMKIYNYENGEAKQLLAPALVFPVTKAPDEARYYQKNIVVPLVKELLEYGGVRPYPMIDRIRIMPPMPEPAIEIQTDMQPLLPEPAIGSAEE